MVGVFSPIINCCSSHTFTCFTCCTFHGRLVCLIHNLIALAKRTTSLTSHNPLLPTRHEAAATMVRANNGIEVFLVRCNDNTRYQEYTIPAGSPEYTGKQDKAYIEVVAGERYKIVTKVPKKFSFNRTSHLEIEYSVDGGKSVLTQVPREAVQKAPGRTGFYEDSYESISGSFDGAWRNCGLTFAAVLRGMCNTDFRTFSSLTCLEEIASHSDNAISRSADRLGTIVVAVRRGNSDDYIDESSSEKSTAKIEAGSGPVVNDHRISHFTKSVSQHRSQRCIY